MALVGHAFNVMCYSKPDDDRDGPDSECTFLRTPKTAWAVMSFGCILYFGVFLMGCLRHHLILFLLVVNCFILHVLWAWCYLAVSDVTALGQITSVK